MFDVPALDLERLREETSAFCQLRPWYPRDYRCLFDSFALSEFLFARRIFSRWVFGVQVMPFGAHCWLQIGELVLNESIEEAGRYTPILAI